MKHTTIRLADEDHDALAEIAKNTERTVAQVIRLAIRRYLASQNGKVGA
jgi:predicted transcriptional regulator